MEKMLVTATILVLLSGLLASCAQAFGVQCTQDPVSGKIICSGAYTPAVETTPPPPATPGPERG